MPDLGTILYYIGLWSLAALVLQEARGYLRTIKERLVSLLPVFLVIHLSFLLLLFAWQRQTLDTRGVNNPNGSAQERGPETELAIINSAAQGPRLLKRDG